MWSDNSFSQKVGIKYPIIQAGMAGGITSPELVASVSNAGGLGSIGAGYMTPKDLQDTIQKVKSLTKEPFSVNLFTPEVVTVDQAKVDQANEWLSHFRHDLNITETPEVKTVTDDNFKQQIDLIIEENIKICSFTFGIPDQDIIDKLKSKGILLIGTATTVDEAIKNEEKGIDIIVMQGSEAGGHRGSFLDSHQTSMIGTMALIPQVVDQVNIPVIAAGGITDGRGLVAALALGAEGVQMGTAFVTSLESGSPEIAKQAILESHEVSTVVTSTFSGKPARGLNNLFIEQMSKYEDALPQYPIQNTLTQPIRKSAAKEKRIEYMSLWCGQNLRTLNSKSASDIIKDTVAQADKVLGQIK